MLRPHVCLFVNYACYLHMYAVARMFLNHATLRTIYLQKGASDGKKSKTEDKKQQLLRKNHWLTYYESLEPIHARETEGVLRQIQLY